MTHAQICIHKPLPINEFSGLLLGKRKKYCIKNIMQAVFSVFLILNYHQNQALGQAQAVLRFIAVMFLLPIPAMSFNSLGLSDTVLKGIRAMGYEDPTPIQLRGIPLILEGRDVIGSAQTGTGKTAAFGLPILTKLDKPGRPTPSPDP